MTSSDFNATLYSGYFSYCILIVKLTTQMKIRKKKFTGAVTFALEIDLSTTCICDVSFTFIV